MKVACFTLMEPFTSFEHQLVKIKEMGFDCCDIAATHDGASLLTEYDFSSSVSLDSNPFEVKRLAENTVWKLSVFALMRTFQMRRLSTGMAQLRL